MCWCLDILMDNNARQIIHYTDTHSLAQYASVCLPVCVWYKEQLVPQSQQLRDKKLERERKE